MTALDLGAGIAARRRDVRAQLTDIDLQLVELRALREQEHDDDEHDPDGVSLSSEWSRLEGLRQTTEAALEELDAAAERARHGEGTACAVCGEQIPAARLEARPGATTCVRCAR